jgi:hypothetical protein
VWVGFEDYAGDGMLSEEDCEEEACGTGADDEDLWGISSCFLRVINGARGTFLNGLISELVMARDFG